MPRLVLAQVRINEIAWMGTEKSQYSEWLELYNEGDEAVSLAGWKLYKAGDVLYTLSKSIAAKGYLLIERTTTSAPDAVSGISDEAGPFGAGGLRNTGEDLILKDKSGAAIDTLSFAKGWPAGDAEANKSMQWNGEQWITAIPTPDAVNATVTDVLAPLATSTNTGSITPKTVTSTPTAAKAATAKTKTVSTKSKLTVTAPKNIFQGAPNEFGASFEMDAALKNPQGYFYWNMGDGATYMQTALTPINHTYHYPGTYTVSLSYYATPSASKPFLTSTASAMVTVPLVTLETVNNGAAVQLTNNTTKAMDIGRWPIASTEGIRAMPDMTVIAAKAHIIISAALLGLTAIHTPVLSTPDGTKVLGLAKKAKK